MPFAEFCVQSTGLSFQEYGQLVTKLCSTQVLVVDDLGNGDVTWNGDLAEANRRQIEIANIIVGNRHRDRRATIVTSNLSPDHIARQFGERIGSRIAEFDKYEVRGADLRRMVGKNGDKRDE